MNARARLIAIPVGCVVLAVACAAPLLVVHLLEGGLPADERFIPAVAQWAALPLVLGVGTPLVLGLVLATAGRRALAGRSRRFRAGYIVGTLAGQVVVALALAVTAFATDPHFLGGELLECVPAPGGGRVACLYDGGMLCGFDVYLQAPGRRVMKRAQSVSRSCAAMPERARLRWRADGDGVDLLDGKGQPVTSEPFTILPVLR